MSQNSWFFPLHVSAGLALLLFEMCRLVDQRTKCIYLCKTVRVNLYVVTPQDFTCGGFGLVQLSSLYCWVLGVSQYPSKPSLKIISSELLLTLEDLWMLSHLALVSKKDELQASFMLTHLHEACLLIPSYTNSICNE